MKKTLHVNSFKILVYINISSLKTKEKYTAEIDFEMFKCIPTEVPKKYHPPWLGDAENFASQTP